ncbi:MAG: 30S ribosomal protein S12 methylthiotransferase RimO [Bacilli bacterium]|nr:30S ribosomal protein S12 methylthiotransferase RimO [Bacilli bacterium]
MKKVGIISLGCAKNLVDSENILGLLDKDKYVIVNNVKDADYIFVNTCGFIESSKRESINTILEMCSYHKKVFVLGCLVQRYKEELEKEIPEVVRFIPIREYFHLNDILSQVDEELNESGGVDDKYRIVSTGSFSAYLKIGEGCDNRCSYCAIPLIRGGFVSRPYEDIIIEANKLAKKGYKELIVLEQDTTKYGIDLHNGENIVKLLKGLLEIKELDYIRLLYLYPDEISDELIDLIAKEKRLTPYFDIPIQHSEDSILKAMHRRGSKDFLRQLFKKIRDKVPHAVIRTTVMVGFPGETEKDFKNLKSFIEEIGFDHLGAFTYSREEGTASYDFPHQVRESTKQRRLDEIMELQQKISFERNQKHIGEEMEGLIVGEEDGQYLFRSYWNAPDDVDGNIYIKKDKDVAIGEKVKVKIDQAFVYDLIGHLL